MYNKIVETLKIIARDSLRMNIVVRLQSEANSFAIAGTDALKTIQDLNKEIARVQFKTSLLVEADPDFTEKTESYTKRVASLNTDILDVQKSVDALTKAKANVEAQIAKVQSGEVKVCLDQVNALTKDLIAEVTKDIAVQTARGLATS